MRIDFVLYALEEALYTRQAMRDSRLIRHLFFFTDTAPHGGSHSLQLRMFQKTEA
jgi:hypothetical protein